MSNMYFKQILNERCGCASDADRFAPDARGGRRMTRPLIPGALRYAIPSSATCHHIHRHVSRYSALGLQGLAHASTRTSMRTMSPSPLPPPCLHESATTYPFCPLP